MNSVRYVVVTPVRNEEKFLPFTIESMKAQTIVPTKWIIVDDGSTDRTGEIAKMAARSTPWIEVVNRSDRGFRKAGGGVIEAFYDGYRQIEQESFDYLVKLDGDLSFESDYFERCFERFANNARLGIAGGTICDVSNGLVAENKDPKFHVRGATKIYRYECWREIGGLIQAPGWDTLDEVKANMLQWETATLQDIEIKHYRPAGNADGILRDRIKGGLGNYITGYHPLFMLLKCAKRIFEKPYLVGSCGLLYGFLKGYATRTPRVEDKVLIRYFRQQQISYLLGKKSLWNE